MTRASPGPLPAERLREVFDEVVLVLESHRDAQQVLRRRLGHQVRRIRYVILRRIGAILQTLGNRSRDAAQGGQGQWAWPNLAAVYVIVVTPGIVAFTLAQRLFFKGLMEGALKG